MTPSRLRIAADPDQVARGIVNAIAGAPVAFWRGSGLRIELALFRGAALGDPGNIASLTARVKASQTETATLMSKTIVGGDLDLTLTLEQWKADTAEHAVLEFAPEESNLPLADKALRKLWLVVVATLDDGQVVTLAAGQITCHEPNTEAGDPPDDYPPPIILPGPQGEPGNSLPASLVAAVVLGSNCFIHINGDGQAEKADAVQGKEAHGFTPQAIAQGVTFEAWKLGAYNGFSGLTPGAAYWLGTAGQPTATAPTLPSLICQRLGTAVAANILSVDIETPITL